MKPISMISHPEGGSFSEVYRSKSKVINDSGIDRQSLTHIYFSLGRNEVSKFHKVKSDEVWNLYEGNGLCLFIWDGKSENIERVELSANKKEYCHVIEAGMWQAAEPIDSNVLAGCSVAPGFEFEDFELIKHDILIVEKFLRLFPELKKFV